MLRFGNLNINDLFLNGRYKIVETTQLKNKQKRKN